VFASAQMTLEECKYVNRYEVSLENDDLPELDLVHWDPQPGCVTQRHYNRHEFNWIPDTDIPACDATIKWFAPEEMRPGKYPWQIVVEYAKEDECCQDDFFWCPNVQDPPLDCEEPESLSVPEASISDIQRLKSKSQIGSGILADDKLTKYQIDKYREKVKDINLFLEHPKLYVKRLQDLLARKRNSNRGRKGNTNGKRTKTA
jgi:hypothetical protein